MDTNDLYRHLFFTLRNFSTDQKHHKTRLRIGFIIFDDNKPNTLIKRLTVNQQLSVIDLFKKISPISHPILVSSIELRLKFLEKEIKK